MVERVTEVKDLAHLLILINEPCDVVDCLKFEGGFSLVSNDSSICSFGGVLVLTRNPVFPFWHSVERFVENRESVMPDFSAQFYVRDKWVHVPYRSLSSSLSDYLKAGAFLGSIDSGLEVEANLYLKK